MAELITTPEEDAAETYMGWSDEALGRWLRHGVHHLRGIDTAAVQAAEQEFEMRKRAAFLCLVLEAHNLRATQMTIEARGVELGSEGLGDWQLTLRRVDKSGAEPGVISPVRACRDCMHPTGGRAKPERAPSPSVPVMANVPVCSICGQAAGKCEVDHAEA